MNNKNGITRRKFVKQTASGLAGVIVAPTILHSCVKGANDNIHVAHIGTGRRGYNELVSYFLPVKNSRSVATCDVFTSKRNTVAEKIKDYYKKNNIESPECKTYLKFEEVLERDDIDAVHITTPDHWHVPIAIKAARAGKHIHLAKPLGLSYDNFLTLKKETEKAGVIFQYGTQQRSYGHVQLVKDLIDDGILGKIERVDVWAPSPDLEPVIYKETPVPEDLDYDRWQGPAPVKPYHPQRIFPGAWFCKEYAIGFIAGWGAHPLDVLLFVLKNIVKTGYSCEGIGTYWPEECIYDTVYSWNVKLNFNNGIEGRLMSDNFAKPEILKYRKGFEGNGTTFFGEKGWISVGRSTVESNIPGFEKKFENFARDKKWNGFLDSNLHGQNFIDTIQGKRKELAPLDEAIASDCISHMGNIAIKTGKQIHWDPIAGKITNDAKANELFYRKMRAPYNL